MNHIINLCVVWIRLRLKLDKTLKRVALPFLALMLLPSFSSANIYRCVSDSGVVTYSDVPCGKNAVVAFKKNVVSVEEAAGRNVIRSNTDRAVVKDVLKDVIHHAKQVGSCILPEKKCISNTVSYPVTTYSSNADWAINLFCGYEGHYAWQIDISYEMRIENPHSRRMRTIKAARLKTVKISRDHKPFDPDSMENLKAFRKIQNGIWQYQK